MSDKRDVSVVIPTKNGGDLFRAVLAKLVEQQGVSIDLVVIDSGSSDNTVHHARQFGARVTEIPPDEFNHGLTRDLGIKLSRAEYVVLMTQDALPGDDWLLYHLTLPFDDPNIAGCYVRQVARPDADVLTERNLRCAPTGRLQSEMRALVSMEHWRGMTPIERFMLCNFDNVCSALRKSVWQSIPFGTASFGEDITWSMRVLQARWKIAYVAESFVVHSHDRPLRYDYRRTYVTHRLLYELYGMVLVPTLRHALHAIIATTRADWKYAEEHEKSQRRLWPLLAKIPLLSIASILGQYVGARDGIRGRGKHFSGI